MGQLILFADGSVNPQLRVGVGVYFIASQALVESEPDRIAPEGVADGARSKVFESTPSTRLEIQTLNWALGDLEDRVSELSIYTDSQCAVGLPERRERLAKNEFKSEKGRELNNADVYREFFSCLDQRDASLIKIEGHSDFRYQNSVQRIFHYVDREARRLLKKQLRETGV